MTRKINLVLLGIMAASTTIVFVNELLRKPENILEEKESN